MILETEIRGSRHAEGAQYALRNYVHRGDALALERDATNKFSCAAIKVYWGSQFLGFVADEAAQRIAPVIDSHQIVTAFYQGHSRIALHTPVDV